MSHDGHTIAVMRCAPCPPLREWPMRNLITGQCPRCTAPNDKAWREAAARRLVAEQEPTGEEGQQ